MTTLLPDTQKPRVTQTFAKLSAVSLEAFDHVIFVIPKDLPARAWSSLPDAPKLQKLLKRAKKHGAVAQVRSHINNRNTTGVTLVEMDVGESWPDSFSLLSKARSILTDALTDKPSSLAIATPGFSELQAGEVCRALLLATYAVDFDMPEFKGAGSKSKSPTAKTRVKKVTVFGKRNNQMIDRTVAEAGNLNLARWLTALPPNKLDARAYRKLVKDLAKQYGWQVKVHDEAALKKAGAGAFLAVSQGNAKSDAAIIQISYRPQKKSGKGSAPDLALVGKGIIFDTGGTNLKPFKGMLDMHEDMAGSAVALSTLAALTELKAPVAVDCWLAITENRIGPEAYKPRDIVTASNGTTIEVIHTDAEGRMALADTLALAGKKQPKLIIDYATLTGSCVAALTERYSGAFTNRDTLHGLIREAGKDSGERIWTFPMDDDFDEEIQSKVADVLQCAPAGGGDHIQAARFLKRFVPEQSAWVHVDLSSSNRPGGLAQVPGGPTGFGIRFTLDLILNKKALKTI